MALLVDIESNQAFTPLKDVYVRINSINVKPNFRLIKIGVAGYVAIGCRDRIRQIEQEQIDFAATVWTEGEPQIVGGSAFLQLLEDREEFYEPPYDAAYPVHVWYDTYTVGITADMDLNDQNLLHQKLYELIKGYEYRFTNIRDDFT